MASFLNRNIINQNDTLNVKINLDENKFQIRDEPAEEKQIDASENNDVINVIINTKNNSMKVNDESINSAEMATASQESRSSSRKMSAFSDTKQIDANNNNDVLNVKINTDDQGMMRESPASHEARSSMRKLSSTSNAKNIGATNNIDVLSVIINTGDHGMMTESAASQESRSSMRKVSSASEEKQINMSNNSCNNDVLNIKIRTGDKVDNNQSINAAEKSKQNLESTSQNFVTEGKSTIRQEASESTRKMSAQTERKMSLASETNKSLSASAARRSENKASSIEASTNTENDSNNFYLLEPDQTIVFPGRWYLPGRFNTIFKDLNLFQNSQDNMVIRMQDDESKLEITLDTSKYKPEELSVSVENGAITVEGKHEEKSENGWKMASRQFHRRYTLPRGCTTSDVTSNLSSDGVLVVTAVKKEHKALNVEINQN